MTNTSFNPGQTVATRGLHACLTASPSFYLFTQECMIRHLRGDWGDICAHDQEVNDLALASGQDRIVSSYKVPDSIREGFGHEAPDLAGYLEAKLWIITEWDRSYTTMLWPSEY